MNVVYNLQRRPYRQVQVCTDDGRIFDFQFHVYLTKPPEVHEIAVFYLDKHRADPPTFHPDTLAQAQALAVEACSKPGYGRVR